MHSLTAYLFIGAVLAGIALGESSEECGVAQINNFTGQKLIAITLTWPAAFVSTAFYDYEIPSTDCSPSK